MFEFWQCSTLIFVFVCLFSYLWSVLGCGVETILIWEMFLAIARTKSKGLSDSACFPIIKSPTDPDTILPQREPYPGMFLLEDFLFSLLTLSTILFISLPSEWRLTEVVRNSIHRHVGGARNPRPCEMTPELEAFCPDVQNGPPRLANFLAVYLGNPELAREATLCCEPVTCRPFECRGREQVFPFFQYFLQLRLTFFQLI